MEVISWVQSGKMARVSREIWRTSVVDGVCGSLNTAPGANSPFQSPPAPTSIACSARRAHAFQSIARTVASAS
jgi:hypothetical protein